MTNKLKKLLVASLLIASSTYAGSRDSVYDSNSLVGFEGGYTKYDVKDSTTKVTDNGPIGGMKVGAETEKVRMFLSLKNANITDDNFEYDYAYMYGAELQYLFNFSSFANLFVGVNIGKVSLRFDDGTNTRDLTTGYTGGDAGFNFHIGDSFDLEVGGRIVSLDKPEHTLSGQTYTFGEIVNGYVSLIFKYQMDD